MNEPVLSVEVDTLVMVREADGGGAACVSRSFRSFPTASVLNIRKLLCRGSAEPQFHTSEEKKAPPSFPVSQSVNFPTPHPSAHCSPARPGKCVSHRQPHTAVRVMYPLGHATLALGPPSPTPAQNPSKSSFSPSQPLTASWEVSCSLWPLHLKPPCPLLFTGSLGPSAWCCRRWWRRTTWR